MIFVEWIVNSLFNDVVDRLDESFVFIGIGGDPQDHRSGFFIAQDHFWSVDDFQRNFSKALLDIVQNGSVRTFQQDRIHLVPIQWNDRIAFNLMTNFQFFINWIISWKLICYHRYHRLLPPRWVESRRGIRCCPKKSAHRHTERINADLRMRNYADYNRIARMEVGHNALLLFQFVNDGLTNQRSVSSFNKIHQFSTLQ